MDITEQLDSIVATHDLNAHPFYLAWRAGTLPRANLEAYAGEYRAFIATLADAWDTLGERAYAADERAHTTLWDDFKTALGVREVHSLRPEVEALLTTARSLFQAPPEALGALYAFEAQQRRTARSKLDGLDAHYPLDDRAKRYFAVHAADDGELTHLRTRLRALPETELARAHSACTRMCLALLTALDGLYEAAPAR